jgi:hypothetical protein
VEEHCGILQWKQQGNVSKISSSSALWLSEYKGHNEDVPDVIEKRHKRGNLDRQTTLVNVISHQCYITMVKCKMMLRWETEIPNLMNEEKF